MARDDAFVQAVRDAVDIVDIAGQATTLTKKGKRYEGLCPFHKEKTPSFSVDPDQGLYYCFGCGAGGDAIRLHMEQTGDDFPAALEGLARRYGVPIPARSSRQPNPQESAARKALEAAAEFFRQALQQSPGALAYLKSRRLEPEVSDRFALGYAPEGWRHLLQALAGKVPVQALEDAGLVGRSARGGGEPFDRFRHRLMFPIHSPGGRLVGFGGRTLGDDRAKYINTSETEQFHKGRLLYGFHLAKRAMRDGGKALLVEGYTDVLAAASAGIDWVVAGMGTALTPEQARLLGRYAREVIVAYDGDAAGQRAFRRGLPLLLAEGLTVRRADFPEGHDPDSLRLEEGPEALRLQIEQAADAIDWEIERLAPAGQQLSPAETSQAAGEITELLRPIRDPVLAHAYIRRAAQRLAVPEALLRRPPRRRPRRRPRQEAEPAPDSSVTAPRETFSAEEQALRLLLEPTAEIPPAEELPAADIFFDRICRNIYQAFCALYRGGDGGPPNPQAVQSQLSNDNMAIDRTARILLQEASYGPNALAEALSHLELRWQRSVRAPELMRQIRQAQSESDQARLDWLLKQKIALTRSLHPGAEGKLW